MGEHLFHFLPTIFLFAAISWLLLGKRSLSSFSKIGVVIVTCSLITLFALPIHYWHASHTQMQKYDCCLPSPVEVPTFFAVLFPVEEYGSFYQISIPNYLLPAILSLNNRSPPIG